MMLKESIQDYALVAVCACTLSLLITPLIRRLCQRNSIFDIPTSSRKIHTTPMPSLGGAAIYLGFFLPLFAVFLSEGGVYELFLHHHDVFFSLFFASTLVFAVGVYDDIRGATVGQKFLVQTAAAALLYFLGFKITLVSVPFVGSVNPGLLAFPLTILWFVGVTNALNFVDGIDGLACGVGFFSLSTMFFLSLFLNHPLTAFFAAALAGSVLGFGVYNFAPASIFMGDSGSLFIGFVIAAISLHGSQKSSTAVVLLIPIVALGVPITDTLLAILRRVSNGLSPFTADREHIHHRLLRMGLSTRQVVLGLYAICCLLGVTALLMTSVTNQVLTVILIILSIVAFGGMKMLGYTTDVILINALAKERIQQKRRTWQRQRFAEEILTDIENAVDPLTFQKAVVRYFESMEFDVGTLHIFPEAIEGSPAPATLENLTDITWCSTRYEDRRISRHHLRTISMPLLHHEYRYAELSLGQYVSTSAFLESMVLIEQLVASIEKTCVRIIFAKEDV